MSDLKAPTYEYRNEYGDAFPVGRAFTVRRCIRLRSDGGRQGHAGMRARLANTVPSLDGIGLRNKVTSLDPGTGFTVRAAWFPT